MAPVKSFLYWTPVSYPPCPARPLCIRASILSHTCVRLDEVREQPRGLFFREQSTLFFRQCLSLAWSLTMKLGWLGSESQGSLPPVCEVTRLCHHAWLLIWVLGTKLKPFALERQHITDWVIDPAQKLAFKIFVLDDSIINIKSIIAIIAIIAATTIQFCKRMSSFLRRQVPKNFRLKIHWVSNFLYFQACHLDSILGPKWPGLKRWEDLHWSGSSGLQVTRHLSQGSLDCKDTSCNKKSKGKWLQDHWVASPRI